MSQNMVIISVIVVFIVLVVILMSKDTGDTPADDSKDASPQEPSVPNNADDPFKSAVSPRVSEESPVSDGSAPDVEEDVPNPFKAPS